MEKTLLAPTLRAMLAEEDREGFREFGETVHPEVAVECLAALEPEEAWRLLSFLDPSLRAKIFSRFEDEFQVRMAQALDRAQLAALVTDMPHDERADLVNFLSEEKQQELYRNLARSEREDVRRLASYEEDTAGAVMTSDYVALRPEQTAAAAIADIRREAPQRETIYYCYVVDTERRLIGIASLRDLILAPQNKPVEEIMSREVISARADEDREATARKIAKYDLIALPVTDENGVLVGIVTHDDAMDIVEEEVTEDMMHMAGASAEESLSASIWGTWRLRRPWLFSYLILVVPNILVIKHFGNTIKACTALAAMMPIVAGMSGSVGNQTMVGIVRAMALDELKNIGSTFFREIGVAFINGVCFGLLNGLIAYLLFANFQLAAVVFVSMVAALTLAGLFGTLYPIVLRMLKVDPALASNIFISTSGDLCGFLIILSLAQFMSS